MILKNMFDPDELIASPSLKDELEADIRSECAKLGKVDKVRARYGPLALPCTRGCCRMKM